MPCRRMQIEFHHHPPCEKLSKWSKELNTRQTDLIEERVENRLEFIGTGKDFVHRTPIAHTKIAN